MLKPEWKGETMAVDKTFLKRSIPKKESLIVAYSAFTNMPYVECDPETFNDQVFLFDSEEDLKEFAKPYIEKKQLLRGIKYENKGFLSFFSMLYQIGVNELVFVNGQERNTLELQDLVNRPDFSKLPKEKQPISNPQLQLTGLYFMQEASRPVPQKEKEGLEELQEELYADLLKARFVVPMELMEGPESDAEKLKNRKYRIPMLKNKNGDTVQPIFTDNLEFAKMNRENKLRALAMPFDALAKAMVKEAKGFILNPGGYHIVLPRNLIEALSAPAEEE